MFLDQQKSDLQVQYDSLQAEFNIKVTQQNENVSKTTSKLLKNRDKVTSQLLQLSSVASHLKDMVKLGKIQDTGLARQNEERVVEYIQENLEGMLDHCLHLLGFRNSHERSDSVENSCDDEYVTPQLKTRAQNFKKFRQSTQLLIQRLFDNQLHSKKLIINDLENLIIKENEDYKHQINTQHK